MNIDQPPFRCGPINRQTTMFATQSTSLAWHLDNYRCCYLGGYTLKHGKDGSSYRLPIRYLSYEKMMGFGSAPVTRSQKYTKRFAQSLRSRVKMATRRHTKVNNWMFPLQLSNKKNILNKN